MQANKRFGTILSKFTSERPEWRQAELARELGLSPSALSRNLATLTQLAFLRHNEDSGTYSLGPTIVELAGVAINHYDEFRNSYSELHNLMSQTLLGVNLGIPHGQSVMYLIHIDGPQMHRGITLIGRKIPLHCTALGKILLSGLSSQELKDMIRSLSLDSYTTKTITDPEQLYAEVQQARQRGYAVEDEELAPGRGCIAAPVFNRTSNVVAAVSLSGPKNAIKIQTQEGHYANLLRETVDRISSKMGYVPVPRLAVGE